MNLKVSLGLETNPEEANLGLKVTTKEASPDLEMSLEEASLGLEMKEDSQRPQVREFSLRGLPSSAILLCRDTEH
jgi:hypothetical protein